MSASKANLDRTMAQVALPSVSKVMDEELGTEPEPSQDMFSGLRELAYVSATGGAPEDDPKAAARRDAALDKEVLSITDGSAAPSGVLAATVASNSGALGSWGRAAAAPAEGAARAEGSAAPARGAAEVEAAAAVAGGSGRERPPTVWEVVSPFWEFFLLAIRDPGIAWRVVPHLGRICREILAILGLLRDRMEEVHSGARVGGGPKDGQIVNGGAHAHPGAPVSATWTTSAAQRGLPQAAPAAWDHRSSWDSMWQRQDWDAMWRRATSRSFWRGEPGGEAATPPGGARAGRHLARSDSLAWRVAAHLQATGLKVALSLAVLLPLFMAACGASAAALAFSATVVAALVACLAASAFVALWWAFLLSAALVVAAPLGYAALRFYRGLAWAARSLSSIGRGGATYIVSVPGGKARRGGTRILGLG